MQWNGRKSFTKHLIWNSRWPIAIPPWVCFWDQSFHPNVVFAMPHLLTQDFRRNFYYWDELHQHIPSQFLLFLVVRYFVLLWQARWDQLKENKLFCHMSVQDNPYCEDCLCLIDIALHVIRDCHKADRIWRHLIPRNYWKEFFKEQGLRKWLNWNLA